MGGSSVLKGGGLTIRSMWLFNSKYCTKLVDLVLHADRSGEGGVLDPPGSALGYGILTLLPCRPFLYY